ncbi:uncharacterized protein F54H12.2-like [Microplitis demolitor]|uniref:uncharacterized protein F54H12.2-like n=1 Tax=Microplitis demolitor TaxID=69319 RepID=UPI0006D51E90|nr:uncharacterized protein F54H12.2-like [Microplitis demolitor]
MAFLHSHSSEFAKSELDLFTIPSTQTSIEYSQWTHYNPVSSITDDSPIEFVIPGHGDEYIDLPHSMLKIRAQIIAADETHAAADKVGPVNNLLYSMFNQIDVFFNQKLILPPNNAYAYRAYIETILNYRSDAKNSHSGLTLRSNDTSGAFDHPVGGIGENDNNVSNKGLEERAGITRNGAKFDLLGHLHSDIFNQDEFLLNGVEMRLRLVHTKNSFVLWTVQIKITKYICLRHHLL